MTERKKEKGAGRRCVKGDREPGVSRLKQHLTIVNLSIRRYFFTRYMWLLIFIGGLPLFFAFLAFLIRVLYYDAPDVADSRAALQVHRNFQMMFRVFYIHFIIFFIANAFGFSLLRKEADDRTLHYLFMQPVSKVTVILSKFIGFLLVTWIYLSVTFLLTYVFFFLPYGVGAMVRDLFQEGRALDLLRECFVMLIALAMYGSFSMVMGSIFKTGWYGLIFYMWETGLAYLPTTMKYFTISFYLQGLTPAIEKAGAEAKVFEIYSDPPSILRCLVTLGAALAIFIGITIFLIRRYECEYGED